MPKGQPKKPDLGFVEIQQRGEKAHGLVIEHRAKVEPRLPPGVIDGLATDLVAISQKREASQVAGTTSKAATATQNGELDAAYRATSAIRTGVVKSGAPADVRKGYGLGTKVRAETVTSVVSAATVIVERAGKHPEEARSVGILPEDIETLKALVATLQQADDAQEKTRALRPLSTGERNKVARRIVEAVRRISAAGVLAFMLDEELRARFDALDDMPKAPKKKQPTA